MKKILNLLIFLIAFSGISQEHSGGIVVPTGFKIAANAPVDDRFVVADSLSLYNLPNKYDGMFASTIDGDERILWIYNEVKNEWSKVGKPSEVNTLQEVLTKGNTTDQFIVSTGGNWIVIPDTLTSQHYAFYVYQPGTPKYDSYSKGGVFGLSFMPDGRIAWSNFLTGTDGFGSDNTPYGFYALENLTKENIGNANNLISRGNLAVGNQSMRLFERGTRNTAVGGYAGRDFKNGDGNTLVGYWAGSNANDTLIGNTIIGNYSLPAGTSSLKNNIIISSGAISDVNKIGFRVFEDGTSVIPRQTQATFDSDTTGKAIVTKEILEDAIDELRGLDLNDFTNNTPNRYVRLDETLVKLEEDMTFTVGVGKDFETIEEAIDQALNYYPNADYKITILIDEGYEINANIFYQGLDFSHIIIKTTGVITVNPALIEEDVFRFENCWLPMFDEFYINGPSSLRLFYFKTSFASLIRNSKISGFRASVTYQGVFSARIEGSIIEVPAINDSYGINVQNSYVRLDSDTQIVSLNTDNLNLTTYGAFSNSGSVLSMSGAPVLGNFRRALWAQNATITSSTQTLEAREHHLFVDRGATIINRNTGTLTSNVPLNTLSGKGIILNENKPNPIDFNGTDYILDYIKAPSGQEYNVTVDDTGKLKSEPKPTIPTKTSDLTNDSGFITSSDLPAPQSLNDVLSVGSVATSKTITITETGLGHNATIGVYTFSSNNGAIPTTFARFNWADGFSFGHNGYTARINRPGNLTNNSVHQLQDKSGTFAHLEDIENHSPKVYSVEITLSKSDINNLHTTPIVISSIDLGLESGQGAKFLRERTEVRIFTDGTDFSSTRPIQIGNGDLIDIIDLSHLIYTAASPDGVYAGSGSTSFLTYKVKDEYYITTSGEIKGGGTDCYIKFRLFYNKIDL